jgi:hypothetical protein
MLSVNPEVKCLCKSNDSPNFLEVAPGGVRFQKIGRKILLKHLTIKAFSDLAPWAIVRSTIAHGIYLSEFQRRRATLKLAH